jgi:hypothetical protein
MDNALSRHNHFWTALDSLVEATTAIRGDFASVQSGLQSLVRRSGSFESKMSTLVQIDGGLPESEGVRRRFIPTAISTSPSDEESIIDIRQDS